MSTADSVKWALEVAARYTPPNAPWPYYGDPEIGEIIQALVILASVTIGT